MGSVCSTLFSRLLVKLFSMQNKLNLTLSLFYFFLMQLQAVCMHFQAVRVRNNPCRCVEQTRSLQNKLIPPGLSLFYKVKFVLQFRFCSRTFLTYIFLVEQTDPLQNKLSHLVDRTNLTFKIEQTIFYLPSEKTKKGCRLQSYVFVLTFLQQHLFYQYPFSFPTGSSIYPSTGKVWQNCFGMEALFIICRDGKKRHAATGERHYFLTYEVARKKKL